MKEPFKLRGGTGKKNAYSSMQNKGLINPIQQTGGGQDITKFSNSMKYNILMRENIKPDSFEGRMLAADKDFQIYKKQRDSNTHMDRSSVQITDDMDEKQIKSLNATDRELIEGEDGSFKDYSKGMSFDKAGDRLYPGMTGYFENRVPYDNEKKPDVVVEQRSKPIESQSERIERMKNEAYQASLPPELQR
jgi:hypothetical protein